MSQPLKVQRLLIVSHVLHYEYQGQVFAYGPYAREIDIWADLFPEVEIAAPCRNEQPPEDCLPFGRDNICMRPQAETGGNTLISKLVQIALLPRLVWGLCRTMRRADAVHVRCPGNLGLLGAVFAPMFCRLRVAKYAGQWNGFANERLPVRLQRAVLRSRWWGAPVTVYGEWPDQPKHVVPFFTSMMSKAQVEEAAAVAERRRLVSPRRILFCGRLAPEKRIDVLLDAVARVADAGGALEVTVVGDGPQRNQLERQAADLDLDDVVRFVGAVPFEETFAWYAWADALVLPSVHSEGWPKVIAEAMCHAVLCIAVDHGQLSRMLDGRGILLKHGTTGELTSALEQVLEWPKQNDVFIERAADWAHGYSLEGLRAELAVLLSRQWPVPVVDPAGIPTALHETETKAVACGS